MYTEMFKFVKECLLSNDTEATETTVVPFRKRSEHIERVFMWAMRLIDEDICINKEALLVSAIFHDVGYSLSTDNSKHAEKSAEICEKYLKENGFDPEFINFVVYLVRNHSKKKLMTESDTPIELIVLFEADILDETGALSIVWDCMMEGAHEIQSYDKTYDHLRDYSCKILTKNPMVTDKAKEFWEKKQDLMKEYIKQLSFDLGMEDVI